MEPSQTEKFVEPREGSPTSPGHQPERKRRFRIVKLEERIAPGGGNGNGGNVTHNHYYSCHPRCGGRF
jgi:hypothetical protein